MLERGELGRVYYTRNAEDVVRNLASSSDLGLRREEANARLEKYGPNKLVAAKRSSIIAKFFAQLSELMVVILIMAGGIAFVLGETIDATIIFFIVILNAIIGVIQEYKAEKAIEALKRMISPHTIVIRDGHEKTIGVEELVPGDIIILEEGSKVPADARIIDESMVRVDEASLTGESVPHAKTSAIIEDKDTPLADRNNMIFMGTTITSGRCKAIVVETGMHTEFGKIAGLTSEIKEEKSPLQKELVNVGKFLAKATLVICLVVFALGIFDGRPFVAMFLFAVSLGVAAVPEGLPATMTIALALGVQRMARRKAIIRKLSSVETLGSTTVICTDKTGTLTKNQMTVKRVYLNNRILDVEGEGYEPKGRFLHEEEPYHNAHLLKLLRSGLLCNNAELVQEKNGWSMIGDPTEGALAVSAEKAGLSPEHARQEYARIHEIPFSSDKRMMITVHKRIMGKKREFIAFMKGSSDAVLQRCSFVELEGKQKKLSPKEKEKIRSANENMGAEALRVLGFAYKILKAKDVKNFSRFDEKGFTFQGLQGMIDPPRPEVKDAVLKCREAGIRIFVITGDQGLTAKAIAKEIGIADDETRIFTGTELDALSDEELSGVLEQEAVFARMTAENKMRIVDHLMKDGQVVAVTGDGVNDAPALKRADIGVAMGITGTDVSKEASKMVLTDDGFATIVNAIEEGRTIYSNITKFIRYMLSSNMGEIIAILIAMFLILPFLPPEFSFITAVQILWVNLGTDVLPALALGVEPPASGIMKKKPRNPKEKIITTKHFMDWIIAGFIIGSGTVLAYLLYAGDPLKAGTMAFNVLVLFQLTNVFNCRHETKSIFTLKPWSNPMLLLAVAVTVGLQFAVINFSALQVWFKTAPLSLEDWGVAVLFSLSIVVYDEIRKVLWHIKERKYADKRGFEETTSAA
ncbi:calcium-translocating P-type ATPase, SERCA-type [Candidatus Woesearchaeota archaeon]|nr:calcium-translocating P-type ATPase, SERCA-type [Candidatus Woesearchaeota archaeon]